MRSRNNCRCQNQSAFSLMLGREGLGDTSAHTGDDDANSCLRSLKGIICFKPKINILTIYKCIKSTNKSESNIYKYTNSINKQTPSIVS